MKFSNALCLLSVCAVSACVSGCRDVQPEPYVHPAANVVGKPSEFEPTEKLYTVQEMVENMLKDARFTENYKRVCQVASRQGRARPVLCVKYPENRTGDGRSDSQACSMIFAALQDALWKTGLFDVVDYTIRPALTGTVSGGSNNGDDDDDVQYFGKYKSPNLVMTGHLTRDETDDHGRKVYFHSLRLQVQYTTDATAFWSDTKIVSKQTPERKRFPWL